MLAAYWNRTRFTIEHDSSVGWYLHAYSAGKCIADHLQDTELQVKQQAAEDYDVAFSLWQTEVELPNADQIRAYADFLDEIEPQLCGKGADDVFLALQGVIDPMKRVATLPDHLREIEGLCHIRAWGDRYVEGSDSWGGWMNILDRVRKWAQKLQNSLKKR